jgi:hypothetical protein
MDFPPSPRRPPSLFENPTPTTRPTPACCPDLRLVDSMLRGFGPSLSYRAFSMARRVPDQLVCLCPLSST